jgi:hypothetical protein
MVRAPKTPEAHAAADKSHKSDTTSVVDDTAASIQQDDSSANVATGQATDTSNGAPAMMTSTDADRVEPAAASRESGSRQATQTSPVAPAKLVSSGAAARPVVPTVKPVSDSLIGRRLSQVFAAMQPKDAARVLEQMDDKDVRSILDLLSSKQQAAILGSFPTQRAALIVQSTLRTVPTGGTE